MKWSLQLLFILKNFYFKINFIHFFEDSCLQKFSFTYPCMHYLISSQKKNYAKIMAPEHIWYSIMNFQISIQKCFVINIYSLVLANICVFSQFFCWLFCSDFLMSFALIFLVSWFCFLPICRRRRRRTPMNHQRSA